MDTRVLPFNHDSIAEAARLILAGEPVAVPTETVYGLAADATSAEAVARIYEAKGRPSFNPLIVHVPDLAAAQRIGEISDEAVALAWKHWPGPLTLVVPVRSDAPTASLVTAGLPSVGIRVPDHPAMRALLRAAGRPLAAPSANCDRLDQSYARGTCAEKPRRAHSANHRWWRDQAWHRIHHHRCHRRAAEALAPRPGRCCCGGRFRVDDRGSRATCEPLCALEAAQADGDVRRRRRISNRLRSDRRRCRA